MIPAMNNKFKDIKTFVRKLVDRGLFHVFGSSVINKIIGFLSNAILVRIVSRENYGVYTYALTIFGFIILLNGFGMPSALLQVCSEKHDDYDYQCALTSYATKTGIKSSCAVGILIAIVASFINLPVAGSNRLLLIMALFPIPMLILELEKVYFRTALDNRRFAHLNLLETLLSLIFSVLGAIIANVLGLTVGRVIAVIGAGIFGIKLFGYKFHIQQENLSKAEKGSFIRLSFVSMLNIGLAEALNQFSIVVMGSVLGDGSAIASYRVASIIPTALLFIPGSLMTFVYPYFARNRFNGKWTRKYYKLIMLGVFATHFFITVVGWIIAPFLVPLVFGDQYIDAIIPFRILMVSFLIQSTIRMIPGNLLVTQRKLRFNLLVSVLATVINLGANIMLIKAYASIGAAYAQLLTMSITGLINTIYYTLLIKKIP